MGCESKKKPPDSRVQIVSKQKLASSKQDEKCRYKLASKYIDHMPHVEDNNSRFAVWSDVKEVLFPSCSDPECDIVLNALKVVSRYPWEGSKMQACTPKQQMNFLRNFRLVTSGTLLVVLQFVKDNIDSLWEMVWLKHGTSHDICSRRCHYARSQSCVEHTSSSSDKGPSGKHDSTDGNKVDMKKNSIDSDNGNGIYQHDSDCSLRKPESSTDREPDIKKEFLGIRYPTIETVRLLPRKEQVIPNTFGKTNQVGYIVMPILKAGGKGTDDGGFCSGSEISATFPQLHEYLDRLCSEFVAGHIDKSNNEIRRCLCIEGRCFTNWKIMRHGWNVPWVHMTSKDILISWDAVVMELRCLAGKPDSGKTDILPLLTSSLINFKDHFSDLHDDEDYTSSLDLMAPQYWLEKVCLSKVGQLIGKIGEVKQKPVHMNNPQTLHDICQAEKEARDKDKIKEPAKKELKPVLAPVVEVQNNDNIVSKEEDSDRPNLIQSTETKKGNSNVSKKTETKANKLTKRIVTRSTSRRGHARFGLSGNTDDDSLTTKCVPKPKNLDKTTRPRKRQRVKSPIETTTYGNDQDTCLNKNSNALENSDGENDGPTVLQLLSHPIERLPAASNSLSIYDRSTNQNALYRSVNDTTSATDVFLRQLSQRSNQSPGQSQLPHYSTPSVTKSLDTTTYLARNSPTKDETFRHLRAPLPKKTFDKYSGIWSRISVTSNEKLGGGFLNTKPGPIRSCEKVASEPPNRSTKSKPQWNIDQIMKDHPRRIKDDSLYGISIKKTQARYAAQNLNDFLNVNDTKTHDKIVRRESFQKKTTNEILPKVVKPVKPKDFPLPNPSGIKRDSQKSQKEMWYRNESVSQSRISANNLLELVSANPFNQTVESMMALRRYNCDFDALRGSIPNANIGPRSSPLPKIDAGRVAATRTARPVNSENSIQKPNDGILKKNPSDAKITEVSHLVRRKGGINASTLEKDSELSKHRKSNDAKKNLEITDTKFEFESSPDELPKQSKSENCLKSNDFKDIKNAVCKSASSPGLRSNKYKVEVNNLTLKFVRLKENRTDKGGEEGNCHKSSVEEHSTKIKKDVQQKQRNNEIPLDLRSSTSEHHGIPSTEDKEKQNSNDRDGHNDELSMSCSRGHPKYEALNPCQQTGVDKVAKTIELKINTNDKSASTTNAVHIGSTKHYLHNKKRWLIEYSQNISSTSASEKEETPSTEHPASLDNTSLKDSLSCEQSGNITSDPDLQIPTAPVYPSSSTEDGYQIAAVEEGQTDASDQENIATLNEMDVTYVLPSDTADPTSSDEVLIVGNDELDLVEEVVGGVESISTTAVIDPEENTELENKHDDIDDVSVQTTQTETNAKKSDASVDASVDNEDPFEGSVYVFDDTKKNRSKKSSSSGVNIIRRSVRQHLSPRKCMAEVSDNSIYRDSERTGKTGKKTKGKKSTKARSTSKNSTHTCTSSESDMDGKVKVINSSSSVSESAKEHTESTSSAVFDTDKSLEVNSKKHDTVVKGSCKYARYKRYKEEDESDDAATTSNRYGERNIFFDLSSRDVEPSTSFRIKQKTITQNDMSSANSAIQHLSTEQKRMMEIIKQSSSSRSLPSPASFPPKRIQNQAVNSDMGSSTFSFVPINMKDQPCKGGYAHMEGVTCPYVIMEGYKFVSMDDVLRMFPRCDKACKVVKRVLVKHGGLSRTFCDWDQVYLLDQLSILKGRSVKTGDMLIRVDSLVKHLKNIRERVRDEHFKLRRKGKTDLQCLQD
ncbi:LOW QUALITY PROTEIN: serine-rich adhesin for platelets-like [Argopecten irradians]|uniref:LOW QUALITY PROTEIN: serine-rich adhesin for platelets-like n=1 Tax=Argopecten irradians TaxID=31199 RepID=UPI00371B5E11